MGENITITLHSSHRPTFLHRYTRCRFTVIPIPEGAHYLQASFTRKVSLSLSICRYKIGSFFFFRGGEKSRSSLQKVHTRNLFIFSPLISALLLFRVIVLFRFGAGGPPSTIDHRFSRFLARRKSFPHPQLSIASSPDWLPSNTTKFPPASPLPLHSSRRFCAGYDRVIRIIRKSVKSGQSMESYIGILTGGECSKWSVIRDPQRWR